MSTGCERGSGRADVYEEAQKAQIQETGREKPKTLMAP